MVTTATRRIFIEEIPTLSSAEVCVRGWVYHLRVLGKTTFVIIRDCSGEAQCVAATTKAIRDLHLKVEDAVEVNGTVRNEARSRGGYEIEIAEIKILNRAANDLPFQSSAEV